MTAFRTSLTTPALLAALALLFDGMAVATLVRAGSGATAGTWVTAGVGLLLGTALVALAIFRTTRVTVDADGVEERSVRGARRLKWDEITRVTTERRAGGNVMRLHRGGETWVVNFLAFPKPERVVGFVTERLPRVVKVEAR
jgi:hypothetical protein